MANLAQNRRKSSIKPPYSVQI